MRSSLSPEQDNFDIASEISSAECLLESGLLCMRQRRYVEGLAFFALARERLSPDQAQLINNLDALVQSHASYERTQEELLQASRLFAKADAEQQTKITALELLLSTLPKETKRVSPHSNGSQQYAKGQHLLHILKPSSSQLPTDQLLSISASDEESNQSLSLLSIEPPVFPGLYITCFGRFAVKRLDRPVALCSNRHGQTILRYLVAQAEHSATSDTLMTLLWPEDAPEVAQPRLHTSICALRRSLNASYTDKPGGGYILCKNRIYCLNATIPIQTDVDQFLHYYQVGRQSHEQRITLYEKACNLYTGPYLTEDTYADWSSLQREHLCRLYIDMCRILSEHYLKTKRYEEAAQWANAILQENQCDELAYQQLIQIYAAQGYRSEAFQQYQRCERILREELAVSPMPETTHLIQVLLKNAPSSDAEAKFSENLAKI